MKVKPEVIAIIGLTRQVKSLEERIKMLEDAILKLKGESKGLGDWDNAPEEAMYFAVDSNGEGWHYRAKPHMGQVSWIPKKGEFIDGDPIIFKVDDWTKTLEKRPTNK
jgi:hypothetical protein